MTGFGTSVRLRLVLALLTCQACNGD